MTEVDPQDLRFAAELRETATLFRKSVPPAKRIVADQLDKAASLIIAQAERIKVLEDGQASVNDEAREFWTKIAWRAIQQTRQNYLRDAQLALAGQPNALRRRVALLESNPTALSASDTALSNLGEEEG